MRIQTIELPSEMTADTSRTPYLLVISEMDGAYQLTAERVTQMKSSFDGCAGVIVAEEPVSLGETPAVIAYPPPVRYAMGSAFVEQVPVGKLWERIPPSDAVQRQAAVADAEAHEMDQVEIGRLRAILTDKDAQLQAARAEGQQQRAEIRELTEAKNRLAQQANDWAGEVATARAEKRTYEDANRNCGEIINGLQDDLHRLSTRRGQATAETMGKAVGELYGETPWDLRGTTSKTSCIERGRKLADILGIEVTD